MSGRVCERCGAQIPSEWDNQYHFGTCPACKRGSHFIIPSQTNEEKQKLADDENTRLKRESLLNQYNVIDENPRSGVKHVNCIGLSKLIYNECNMYFKTIEDKDSGKQEIYYYEKGMYYRGGENRIRELTDFYLDELTSVHRKNEVVDYIKNKNRIEREQLEPPLKYINVKNGIYDLKQDKLIEHNPDYLFLNQIPVEYHKDAKCPNIKKFFKDVLYENYPVVMQEMIGYLLYRSYKYHKAFLLYGGGANGKSTCVSLIEKFIGEDNYTSNSLSELIENRYRAAELYGKLMNSSGEIGGGALTNTAPFKHLTGNDTIQVERKYRGSFSFRNYAKLVFNANHIPYPKYDKSVAYFRRWIILVFPRTFEKGKKETNPNILDDLTTKEELEGLLIWAIKGLKRLLKNDTFSYFDDEDEDEVGERYELLSKPEKRFMSDFLKLEKGESIPTDDVYDRYREWADKRQYPVLTKASFSRSIKRYMYDRETKLRCELGRTTVNRNTIRIYKNVMWKDEPRNSFSLETFSNQQPDSDSIGNLQENLKKIRRNKDAGYPITMEWLRSQFDDSFINKALESGVLVKNGEVYDVR